MALPKTEKRQQRHEGRKIPAARYPAAAGARGLERLTGLDYPPGKPETSSAFRKVQRGAPQAAAAAAAAVVARSKKKSPKN